jgi:hypothetical protein
MLTIICIGRRDELSRQIARERARVIARLIKAMAPHQAVTFEVAGYDTDERELWDIPEVRRYVINFAEALMRHGVSLDRLLPQSRDLIMACCAVEAGDEVVATGTVEETIEVGIAEMRDFMQATRSKLN